LGNGTDVPGFQNRNLSLGLTFDRFSPSGREANVYFQAFEHRANAPDYFAGPEFFAE
jgi:hypothetical protein